VAIGINDLAARAGASGGVGVDGALGAGAAAGAGRTVDAGGGADAAGADGSDGAVDVVGLVDAGRAAATGASVLVTVDTTGVTGSAGAGVPDAGEAAWRRSGAPADGWLGALVAWAGALAGVVGGGLADEKAGVPESVPAGLVAGELGPAEPVDDGLVPDGLALAELAADELVPDGLVLAELAADELGPEEPVLGEPVLVELVPAEVPLIEVGVDVDDAEPTAEVAGDVAELTAEVAEPSVDVAELTVDVAAEPSADVGFEMVEVRVAFSGDSAAVAAWAGRENSSMTMKMPAVARAACSAARAMRRAVGCMSSSHSTTDKAARLPSGGGANLADTELLFGHHRTVRSTIGQGRDGVANGPDRPRSPARPAERGLADSSYSAQSSLVWATSRCICSTRASIESKRRVPRSRVPKSIAARIPYRSRSCGASA